MIINKQKFFELIKSNKNNIFFPIGNGGSAAVSDHLVCDLLKIGIKAISLMTQPTISMIANDYGYQKIFSFQLKTLFNSNILLIFSTSGNSTNLIEAAKLIKDRKGLIIGVLGNNGGNLKDLCNFILSLNGDVQHCENEMSIICHELISYLKS